MKPITVIVTASGAPGGPSIIQSLRKVKERKIRIVATDVHRDAAGLYLADKYYIVPYGTDPAYPEEMLKIASRENVDIILLKNPNILDKSIPALFVNICFIIINYNIYFIEYVLFFINV